MYIAERQGDFRYWHKVDKYCEIRDVSLSPGQDSIPCSSEVITARAENNSAAEDCALKKTLANTERIGVAAIENEWTSVDSAITPKPGGWPRAFVAA